VTQRKGTGHFEILARGRPAHAGVNHEKGRSAIRAMARIILEVEAFTDYARGITTSVGIVSGGSAANVVPEHCRLQADLRVRDIATVDALFAQAAAVAERIGMKLESDGLSGGGSDGNFTAAKGVATLDGLGIDGDGAHTHEENMLFSSIDPGTRLMQGLFETLGNRSP
jgi:glutamate carboxypeptidase